VLPYAKLRCVGVLLCEKIPDSRTERIVWSYQM